MGAVTKRIPTTRGDVLVLRTTRSYTIYAVAGLSEDGQQEFGTHPDVKHTRDYAAAVALAKALVAPGRRIFLLDIDVRTWSEIST